MTESTTEEMQQETSMAIATVGQSITTSKGGEMTVGDSPQEATEAPGGGDGEGQMTTEANIGAGNDTDDSDENTTNPTTTKTTSRNGARPSTIKGTTTPLQPVWLPHFL